MKITFKTATFGFYANLNETPTSDDILIKLPIDGTVIKTENEISVQTHIQASWQGTTLTVKTGDVVYKPHNKTISIFYNMIAQICPVVIIGTTMTSAEELKSIKNGGKITITKSANRDFGGRKMSQSEIDELVKNLLQKKNQT